MPWVWEVEHLSPKQVDWYRLWCKLKAADGGSCIDEKERQWLKEKRAYAIEKSVWRIEDCDYITFKEYYGIFNTYAPEARKGI